MADLNKKEKDLSMIHRTIIVILLAFAAACIGFGIYFLSIKIEERAAVEQIEREQREEEQERAVQERLEAVSEELGIDAKYILPDGSETDTWDWSYREYYYKTDNKDYIVVFDENNEIQTIVEDTEIDD